MLSLANSDLPMIMGIVIVVSMAVIAANLVVDILYSIIDPRVRLRATGDAIVVSASVRRQLRAQPRVRESASSP